MTLSNKAGAHDVQPAALAVLQGVGQPWQQRRSELNHSELSNQFIVALDGQVAFLAGKSVDPIKIRVFVKEQLPRWPILRLGFVALLNAFEDEMSPRTLFGHLPLSRSHPRTRDWLMPLVDRLWRVRCSTKELLRDARDKLAATDTVYDAIQRKIDAPGEAQSFEKFKAFRPDIERLASACREVSAALHQFPHQIRVT
jgi:hypothetical protein